MELFLNVTGALVAIVMVYLWLRCASREGFDRRTQLVGLALLILILFPVISVTDDLMAVQNPAETDSSVRRDHLVTSIRSISPIVAAPPPALVAEVCSACMYREATGARRAPVQKCPSMTPIENRPPPIA